MSFSRKLSQGLDAAEDLTTLPFQMTRELIGEDSSLTGRLLKQATHISQAVVTMPFQIAKSFLEDPEEKEMPSEEKKEYQQQTSDKGIEKFEELGRS